MYVCINSISFDLCLALCADIFVSIFSLCCCDGVSHVSVCQFNSFSRCFRCNCLEEELESGNLPISTAKVFLYVVVMAYRMFQFAS